MKFRLLLAILFVLGLGTSGYYTETASAASIQPTLGCCGGDPGAPIPRPQSPTPVPLPEPPTTK